MMKRHKTTHHFLLHILSLLYTDNRYYWHTHTYTHTVTEWGQLSSLFKRAAVSASYKCLCLFMCLCERVWMDWFVWTSERKQTHSCAVKQTTRMWHIQLLINSQHVHYLLYLLIDLYKIINVLALHLLGRETQPSKYTASGQHFL